MKWINFLHLYQPASTTDHNLNKVSDYSYQRIFKALKDNPDMKITLNITGCLLDRWHQVGRDEIIQSIRDLLVRKQIEITGSLAYHALAPLIPQREVIRQIQENEDILEKYLGQAWQKRGFFLPEMAYSPSVSKVIKKMGYDWLILDEIALGGRLGLVDFSGHYQDKASGLKIVFRSRFDSNKYVPSWLLEQAQQKPNSTFITATDGELYGYRYLDPEKYLEKSFATGFETLTVSDFIKASPFIQKIQLQECSWESTEKELKDGQPFILWQEKGNRIHNLLWNLADLAYKSYEKNIEDKNNYWSYWHFVRGLSSCTFWWASEKNFAYIYGPRAWSPDEIIRGADDLMRSIRSLTAPKTLRAKIKGEKIYLKIVKEVWSKHWQQHWTGLEK